MNKFTYLIGTVFIVVLLVIAYTSGFFVQSAYWEKNFPEIGSSSSPRAIDLNNDGVKDIVMGGGGSEFTKTEFGVFALDGRDGSLLWSVPARNQVIGSPVFRDINNDQAPDVIIGGRSAILYAVNGTNGDLLWEYLPDDDSIDMETDSTILNFYNPQFIPDQDGDEVDDILVSYGGFVQALPQHTERPPGSLMVISSKTGSRLTKLEMPDGKETYMSPVVHDFNGDGELSVLFGSGGETIGGHFYKMDVTDLIKKNHSNVKILAKGEGKGFIAPPVLADMNGDGISDIVVNAVDGRVLGFDGATETLLWETHVGEGLEGYTSPAPVNYNDDDVLDFFVSFGRGTGVTLDLMVHCILDGKNGSILFRDTVGTFQYASPLTFDFTEDGNDDVLVVINHEQKSASMEILANHLRVFDLKKNQQPTFHTIKVGSNLGSTPLLTDLDGDGYLDIVYSYMRDVKNFYSFKELMVERIETRIKVNGSIRWGEYMGPHQNGIYNLRLP